MLATGCAGRVPCTTRGDTPPRTIFFQADFSTKARAGTNVERCAYGTRTSFSLQAPPLVLDIERDSKSIRYDNIAIFEAYSGISFFFVQYPAVSEKQIRGMPGNGVQHEFVVRYIGVRNFDMSKF